MKKLITIALISAAIGSYAQDFEGTVTWSSKMEITDPKMKADMEQAQQKMNDPAMQAKMKEAEAAMNDPKMKAMMDANPQMKAQMEARMKMMSGGASAMPGAPSGFTMKIKNGNRLTLMTGPMNMEMLYMKDKDQNVRLDRQNKTYTVLPSGGSTAMQGRPDPTTMVKPKVTKTNETATILGYKCTKYVVEMSERGMTLTQNIWTSTDFKGFDARHMSGGGPGQSMFYEGMEGVPLKIQSTTPQGNMVMEVTNIKKESLNASDFTIPSDFTEQKMPTR